MQSQPTATPNQAATPSEPSFGHQTGSSGMRIEQIMARAQAENWAMPQVVQEGNNMLCEVSKNENDSKSPYSWNAFFQRDVSYSNVYS